MLPVKLLGVVLIWQRSVFINLSLDLEITVRELFQYAHQLLVPALLLARFGQQIQGEHFFPFLKKHLLLREYEQYD
jgi:hypothetical protein